MTQCRNTHMYQSASTHNDHLASKHLHSSPIFCFHSSLQALSCPGICISNPTISIHSPHVVVDDQQQPHAQTHRPVHCTPKRLGLACWSHGRPSRSCVLGGRRSSTGTTTRSNNHLHQSRKFTTHDQIRLWGRYTGRIAGRQGPMDGIVLRK
jgi:hypothetical protein